MASSKDVEFVHDLDGASLMKKKGKLEASSKDVVVSDETGKSFWDWSFDYAVFVKEHFVQSKKDFEACHTGTFEGVTRNIGVSNLRNVVMVEVLGEKYEALKEREADLKKEVEGSTTNLLLHPEVRMEMPSV